MCLYISKTYIPPPSMRFTPSVSCLVLALLTFTALRSGVAHAQEARRPTAPHEGTVVVLDPAVENTWTQLVEELRQPQSQTETPKSIPARQSEGAKTVELADMFRQFYKDFPGAPQSIEAQKLEALLLIDAVADGAEAEAERMEALVASLRSNLAFPADIRAEIAATYEFRKARNRIDTAVDAPRVYQEVARALMIEFPDQPQGPVRS